MVRQRPNVNQFGTACHGTAGNCCRMNPGGGAFGPSRVCLGSTCSSLAASAASDALSTVGIDCDVDSSATATGGGCGFSSSCGVDPPRKIEEYEALCGCCGPTNRRCRKEAEDIVAKEDAMEEARSNCRIRINDTQEYIIAEAAVDMISERVDTGIEYMDMIVTTFCSWSTCLPVCLHVP